MAFESVKTTDDYQPFSIHIYSCLFANAMFGIRPNLTSKSALTTCCATCIRFLLLSLTHPPPLLKRVYSSLIEGS